MRNWLLSALLMSFSLAATTSAIVLGSPVLLEGRTAAEVYALGLIGLAGLLTLGLRRLGGSAASADAWMHPPMLITAYLLVFVGVPGMLSHFNPSMLDGIPIRVRPELLTSGLALILAGMLTLWSGYFVGLSLIRPLPVVRALRHFPVSPTLLVTLYVACAAAAVVRISLAGIAFGADARGLGSAAAFNQWISYLEDVRYLALALISLRYFQGMLSGRWLSVFLVTEIGFALTSGFSKPALALAIILFLTAVHARVQTATYRRQLIAFALLALLIVPISQGIRFHIGDLDARSPISLLRGLSSVVRLTWGAGMSTGWDMFVEKVPGRLAGVAYMPGLIMDLTPSQIPYIGVKAFLAIPLYLVPRAVWPDKPVLSLGNRFSVDYLGLPSDTRSSSAMTMFGEPFMFAGWWGTIAAMFVLGLLMAWIYRNTASAGLTAILIALVPSLIDIEAQFSTKVVGTIQLWVFLTVVYAIIGYSSGASRRRAGNFVRQSPRLASAEQISHGIDDPRIFQASSVLPR
jgi:hypothetical protein